jgi:hypothetical protein
LELNLPFKNAGARGCGFSLGHVAGSLQGDGERGVSERVAGCERSQRQGSGYGLVKLARVAQGANEAVVRFGVRWIVHLCGGDGGAKGLSGFSGRAGGKQVKSSLTERLRGERCGSLRIGRSHGCV